MECSFGFIVGSLQNSSPDNLIWGHNLSNTFSLLFRNKGMEQWQRPQICHPPASSQSNRLDASALWDLGFSVED